MICTIFHELCSFFSTHSEVPIYVLQTDSDASENNQDNEETDASEPEVRLSRAPAYKHLIALHAGKPKGGLKEALKVEPDKVRRLSLSEQALEKATMSHGTDVVRYNNCLY